MGRMLAAAMTLLAAVPAAGENGWALEIFGGSAYQLETPLTIRQAGEPEIDETVRWETRPLRDAPYYSLRLGRWMGERGWELELLHHKLYLAEPLSEVQRFAVSHAGGEARLANLALHALLGVGWSARH